MPSIPRRAAALLVLPLFGACGPREEPAAEAPRPVRTQVAGISAGSTSANYSGTVEARYESQLGFQTSGRISARLIEVGSRVRRGQPLLRLDPAQQALQVVASSAGVEAAASRVAQLRVDLQRTEQLLARQFASQAEVDQQRLALAEAESQLQSARARRQIDVNQRGYTELVADRDGVVTAIAAETGQVVAPGQAVVTVAADGEREVVVSIPESRVDELRQARALQVTLWAHPGRVYAGTLRELAPATDRASRTYAARIAVKDADAAFRLGMTATVLAADIGGRSAMRLPLTAIYDRDGQPMVWLVDTRSGRVAARRVALAGAEGDSVLVASGLAGGETVVTAGVHRLHEGQVVKLLPADGAF